MPSVATSAGRCGSTPPIREPECGMKPLRQLNPSMTFENWSLRAAGGFPRTKESEAGAQIEQLGGPVNRIDSLPCAIESMVIRIAAVRPVPLQNRKEQRDERSRPNPWGRSADPG